MPGLLVGEVAALVALVVMLLQAETTRRPEALRTALGCIHGFAVFAGLELALWEIAYTPEWLGYLFKGSNVFNFVFVGVMIAIVYPERRENGATLPMWEVTFLPVLMTVLWSAASVFLLGRAADGSELWMGSALFLAMHYYLVSGAMIVTLLFDPPRHAPAARLALGERLKSGFGLFWVGLMALWWGQAWFIFSAHWETVFGDSIGGAVLAAVLSLVGVARTVQHGHRKIAEAA